MASQDDQGSPPAPTIPMPPGLEPDSLDQPFEFELNHTPPSFTPKAAPTLTLPPLAFDPPDSPPGEHAPTSNDNVRPGHTPNPSRVFLPIPAHPNTSGPNTPQPSFLVPDYGEDETPGLRMEDLPPEVAGAEISIAPDGSFVETGSGLAAREIKKVYDRYIGVGPSVRSPYAITAFVNQHGKTMYRVGNRGLSAPGAAAASAEDHLMGQRLRPQPGPVRLSGRESLGTPGGSSLHLPSVASSSNGHAPSSPPQTGASTRGKTRTSRLSMGHFWPKSGSAGNANTLGLLQPASAAPVPAPRFGTGTDSGPRKLRKTRSIPDMTSTAPPATEHEQDHLAPPPATGRAHSHTVTGADMMPRVFAAPEPMQPSLSTRTQASTSSSVSHQSGASSAPAQTDMFGVTLQWHKGQSGSLATSPHGSTSASFSSFSAMGTGTGSSEHDGRRPVTLAHPFGSGVVLLPSLPKGGSNDERDDDERERASIDEERNSDEQGPRTSLGPVFARHQLRQMQSFESGVTATPDEPTLKRVLGRARERSLDDSSSVDFFPPSEEGADSPGPLHPPGLATMEEEDAEAHRLSTFSEAEIERPGRGTPTIMDPIEEPEESVSLETRLHSQYNTKVFDILQTYRGLPTLDKLLELGEDTVIRIPLQIEETPQPRDDPRFVIWGEVSPGQSAEEDRMSVSQGTDVDSRGRARRDGLSRTQSSSNVTDGSGGGQEGPQKVLVAATIERWIAQLTSELNYDELLIFFLTYRTYFGPVDLANLLICRFHWALERHRGGQDDSVRKVVRLRTFVAIRYWLLTFWGQDFVPNRELRLLFAGWINALRKDPLVVKNRDALTIVRKLVKTVKDCADSYTGKTRGGRKSGFHKPKNLDANQLVGELRHGTKIVDTLAKPKDDDEDSDVDLDFPAEDDTPFSFPSTGRQGGSPGHTPGVAPARPSTIASTSSATQHTLQMAILQHNSMVLPGGGVGTTPFLQTPATLPIHNNPLQRAFVNTIGRLGRWKRVLNARSSLPAPLGSYANVSAFDLELNATGDLLTVRGGVEQYLKMIDQGPPALSPPWSNTTTPSAQTPIAQPMSPPLGKINVTTSPPRHSVAESTLTPLHSLPEDCEEDMDSEISPTSPLSPPGLEPPGAVRDSFASGLGEPVYPPGIGRDSIAYSLAESVQSMATSVASSPPLRPVAGPSRTQAPRRPPSWQMDIVSIDELDLSDLSGSEEGETPVAPEAQPAGGLRRAARKLPLRRDFEFVHPESVSSMGLQSRSSLRSSMSSSIASDSRSSAASSRASGPVFGGAIQQWQVNAIVDSLEDDEEGDAEAALRRLEGQISRDVQQAKASKVDGWVRQIRARLEAGDYSDEQPRLLDSDEESEDDYGEERERHEPESQLSPSAERRASYSSTHSSRRSSVQLSPRSSVLQEVQTPHADQTTHQISGPSSPSAAHAKPAIEDVVPVEILESRLTATETAAASGSAASSPPQVAPQPTLSRYVSTSAKVHRSFILGCRAEVMAKHFAMIDRELFLSIQFEELVSSEILSSSEDADVHDWSQFLKDRARLKAEMRKGPKTSGIVAVRGRFNLMANFVQSEVVLTHPNERPAVVSKFIRIAWKCYLMNVHSTMVAIIAGIWSDPVQKALKRSWTRVGSFEMRVLNDLRSYASSANDFVHLRQTIDGLTESKPSTSQDPTPGAPHGEAPASSAKRQQLPQAGIPFLGIYLSKLHRHSKLPDLIDPTSPYETVETDPTTTNFEPPAHPEVFASLAPLPSYIQLEPLINVHKQRLIAGIIKSCVEGQHLASRVQYPIDKKIYQRCLRLRGLDQDTLQRALGVYASVDGRLTGM